LISSSYLVGGGAGDGSDACLDASQSLPTLHFQRKQLHLDIQCQQLDGSAPNLVKPTVSGKLDWPGLAPISLLATTGTMIFLSYWHPLSNLSTVLHSALISTDLHSTARNANIIHHTGTLRNSTTILKCSYHVGSED
jgi:hypothetical protein